MKTTSSRRGFSLVEVMVSMTIMSVLMSGVISFYLQNVKSMYASEQRIRLAGQIKRLSNELVVQASRSNQFVLFKSARATDFDGSNAAPNSNNSDRQVINISDPTSPLHPAGDFVVFVYYEIPKPVNQAFHRISKLEGYFLSTTNAGGIGQLKKVVIDLSAAPSTNSIESILTSNWSTTAVFTTYFPQARGLATPEVVDGSPVVDGGASSRMFYMSDARNVIISGQVYSSVKDTTTSDSRTYTDTFSFNVTPRT